MENNKIKFRSPEEIQIFKLKLYFRQNKQQQVFWLCKVPFCSCRNFVCWERTHAMLTQHGISLFSDKTIFIFLH